jgi:hypothetical protein
MILLLATKDAMGPDRKLAVRSAVGHEQRE